MTIETIPDYYIHITADNGKVLTNGDVITKEIYVPLNGDYSMWVEQDEPIENQNQN
jgi:hypothetical protein